MKLNINEAWDNAIQIEGIEYDNNTKCPIARDQVLEYGDHGKTLFKKYELIISADEMYSYTDQEIAAFAATW